MHRVVVFVVLFFAGAALAHQGVQNPAVMERMHAMKTIGENTKVLGQMAKGVVAFDAARARAAAAEIAVQAGRTPGLFDAPETDPKSEALPAIWENFPDFTTKSEALRAAAEMARSIETPQDLTAALGAIGATCKACHSEYRE